ncbi:hypothetical protein C4D60_Mb00t00850 [Musa balbisiana]|uniref:Uncharacterized protein n=1 Tax=Musa balbisiana TaxID=52838 RepID=A0A4S8I7M7_MUSBA|nr:hypothetical protein C4D60_Mb00t00850 [Musa balbisiana]
MRYSFDKAYRNRSCSRSRPNALISSDPRLWNSLFKALVGSPDLSLDFFAPEKSKHPIFHYPHLSKLDEEHRHLIFICWKINYLFTSYTLKKIYNGSLKDLPDEVFYRDRDRTLIRYMSQGALLRPAVLNPLLSSCFARWNRRGFLFPLEESRRRRNRPLVFFLLREQRRIAESDGSASTAFLLLCSEEQRVSDCTAGASQRDPSTGETVEQRRRRRLFFLFSSRKRGPAGFRLLLRRRKEETSRRNSKKTSARWNRRGFLFLVTTLLLGGGASSWTKALQGSSRLFQGSSWKSGSQLRFLRSRNLPDEVFYRDRDRTLIRYMSQGALLRPAVLNPLLSSCFARWNRRGFLFPLEESRRVKARGQWIYSLVE